MHQRRGTWEQRTNTCIEIQTAGSSITHRLHVHRIRRAITVVILSTGESMFEKCSLKGLQ